MKKNPIFVIRFFKLDYLSLEIALEMYLHPRFNLEKKQFSSNFAKLFSKMIHRYSIFIHSSEVTSQEMKSF